MEFAFDSFADFLFMGRHGLYVWSAYGITFFSIAALIFVSRWNFKRWVGQQQRQEARRQRQVGADIELKK